MSDKNNKLALDLSGHTDVFNDEELVFDKNINFVFGENGTGKTTIATEINNQFSEEYNVREFKDFTSLVGENGRLNAISLGKTNTELQKKIEASTAKIAEYKQFLTEPKENESDNIYSRLKKANEDYKKQSAKIDKFLQVSASQIKNMTDPQVAPTSYNKNSFADEIPKATLLSAEEIKVAKETALTKKKNNLPKIKSSAYELKDILTTVNTLLKKKVAPSTVIKELENNQELRQFAQRGTELHKKGDKCAFCGNIISDDRWNELDGYFNDEVTKFKMLIQQKIDKIDHILHEINTIDIPKPIAFYPELEEKASKILLNCINNLKDAVTLLNTVKDTLANKKENLFIALQPLTMKLPSDINENIEALNQLIAENNAYTDDLAQKIQGAKDRLRFSEIQLLLNKGNYADENNILLQLEEKRKDMQAEYDNVKRRLDTEENNLNALYEETTDESAIAKMINKTLAMNGRSSFSLYLAKDDEFGQSGQYNIVGRNGVEREITELSTGEKNAVAILYFLYSLEVEINEKSSCPFFIIIDDPVNSNDDTMQHIITSEITKLYNKDVFQSNNKIVIFTHNTQFFLNVRPYGNKKYAKKYSSYHLVTSLNEKTDITVINDKNDLRTNYDSLWINLVASYLDNNPDGMLNDARRICGSFADFNRIKINDFYGESNIKKTLDVNSHEIPSEEMRTTGITATGLRDALRQLFVNSGYEKHFDDHWAFGETVARSKQTTS